MIEGENTSNAALFKEILAEDALIMPPNIRPLNEGPLVAPLLISPLSSIASLLYARGLLSVVATTCC